MARFYELMRGLSEKVTFENIYGISDAVTTIDTYLRDIEWVRVVMHNCIADVMAAFAETNVRFVSVIFEDPHALAAWLKNGGFIKHDALVALSMEEALQMPRYQEFAKSLAQAVAVPSSVSFCISSFVKPIGPDRKPMEYSHSNTVLSREVLAAATEENPQMKEMYPEHLS